MHYEHEAMALRHLIAAATALQQAVAASRNPFARDHASRALAQVAIAMREAVSGLVQEYTPASEARQSALQAIKSRPVSDIETTARRRVGAPQPRMPPPGESKV